MKAVLGEKERFYIFAPLISGNRASIYAAEFGYICQNRKTLSCSGDTKYKKRLNLGGWDKGRLRSYILQIQIFHSSCLLHFSMLR